jgi:hypothetical protein
MNLQETVKLVARFQPEQATQLRFGDVAGLVLFDRKPFSARRDKSSPLALRRFARSSGICTVRFMTFLISSYQGLA